jgi:hypothetical protein
VIVLSLSLLAEHDGSQFFKLETEIIESAVLFGHYLFEE